VRYWVKGKQRTAAHPFEHKAIVRPADFRPLRPANPNVRVQFHELYEELIGDQERNRLICQEVIQGLREGRSPLVLTERNEHLESLAAQLAAAVTHLIVLRGGMRRKEFGAISGRLAVIPAKESRLLLATGRYVGEGFDDARLGTLFLTLPVLWHGTIAQYVGRLHRLYDGKCEVRVR
jgi:superfamily II DNA or RNA helicase